MRLRISSNNPNTKSMQDSLLFARELEVKSPFRYMFRDFILLDALNLVHTPFMNCTFFIHTALYRSNPEMKFFLINSIVIKSFVLLLPVSFELLAPDLKNMPVLACWFCLRLHGSFFPYFRSFQTILHCFLNLPVLNMPFQAETLWYREYQHKRCFWAWIFILSFVFQNALFMTLLLVSLPFIVSSMQHRFIKNDIIVFWRLDFD